MQIGQDSLSPSSEVLWINSLTVLVLTSFSYFRFNVKKIAIIYNTFIILSFEKENMI